MKGKSVPFKFTAAFAELFRERAKEAGGFPAHRVVALERVAEAHGLEAQVRDEMRIAAAEAELRHQIGAESGGRPPKKSSSKQLENKPFVTIDSPSKKTLARQCS